VRIEHVEADAGGPSVGSSLAIRANVALGSLSRDDVCVEVVYGRPDDTDDLVRYAGSVPLDRPGSFGYTVRVLPRNPLLDSRAELGLVTYPSAPAPMTNGDLR